MPAPSDRRRPTALAVTLLVMVLAVAGCSLSVNSGDGWSLDDRTDRAEDLEDGWRDALRRIADAGWDVHVRVLEADADLADPAALDLDLERRSTAERPDRTLILVTADTDPPTWRILGADLQTPTSGAVAMAALGTETEMRARAGDADFHPVTTFLSRLADQAGVDLTGPPSQGVRDELAGEDAAEKLLGAPFLAFGGLVALVLVAAFLRGRWVTRNNAPMVPIGSLELDRLAVVHGEILCEQPLWIDEIDRPAVYIERADQRMKTKSTFHSQHEDWDRGLVLVTTETVHDVKWKDGYRAVDGVWFQVRDQSGVVWVNGQGASIDGHVVAASERWNDKRKVVRAIPASGPISVRGMVHRQSDGTIVIGGRKGPAARGFTVSVNDPRALSRKPMGCVGYVVLAAVFVAVPVLIGLAAVSG